MNGSMCENRKATHLISTARYSNKIATESPTVNKFLLEFFVEKNSAASITDSYSFLPLIQAARKLPVGYKFPRRHHFGWHDGQPRIAVSIGSWLINGLFGKG